MVLLREKQQILGFGTIPDLQTQVPKTLGLSFSPKSSCFYEAHFRHTSTHYKLITSLVLTKTSFSPTGHTVQKVFQLFNFKTHHLREVVM